MRKAPVAYERAVQVHQALRLKVLKVDRQIGDFDGTRGLCELEGQKESSKAGRFSNVGKRAIEEASGQQPLAGDDQMCLFKG